MTLGWARGSEGAEPPHWFRIHKPHVGVALHQLQLTDFAAHDRLRAEKSYSGAGGSGP